MSQRKVHVVINPAAGQGIPLLSILNQVFSECGVDWDVSITKKAGDAREQARQAAASGVDVVAAFGGDGTVAEVASGLMGTDTPLAILPGGTANVMSVELGIPIDLAAACRVACDRDSIVRPVDMGQVNDHNFILRVGVGFEAAMVEDADRELKDRLGVLAYLWSAVQNLSHPEIAHYKLIIDDVEVEIEGLTCIIANSSNLGQAGINLVPGASISDGMLDVVVVQQANMRALLDILGSITGMKQVQAENADKAANTLHVEMQQNLRYWQGKEVRLSAEPAQSVQYDGEVLGRVAIKCNVIPQAIRVLTLPPPQPTPAVNA